MPPLITTEPVSVADSPALAPPIGNPRFPLMDACRGLAALAVVVVHTGPNAGIELDLVGQLQSAVQVFFAISGFLLFRPYLRARAAQTPEPRLRDFLLRRALRILPAYWFALTVARLAFGPHIVPGVFGSRWWLYYGFGQVYSLTDNFKGLAVAWTLGTEVGFYICLPLFAWVTRILRDRYGWRRPAVWLCLVLMAVSLIVRILNTIPFDAPTERMIDHLVYSLPGQLSYFALGMLLAVISVAHETRRRRPPRVLRYLIHRPTLTWALAAALFMLTATVFTFFDPVALPSVGILSVRARFVGGYLLVAVMVGLFLLPAVFDREAALPQRILRTRPLLYLGLVSYGLYVWHHPIGLVFIRHLRRTLHQMPAPAEFLLIFAVMFSFGLAAATASYYLVELPFLRLKPGISTGGRPAGNARWHALTRRKLPGGRPAAPTERERGPGASEPNRELLSDPVAPDR